MSIAKDEPSRWLGDNPSLAAKLGGAVAFAFANRGDGGIVGVHDLAVEQRLAWGHSWRLVGDPLGCVERRRQLRGQTRALVRRQVGRVVPVCLGGSRQGQDLRAYLEQVGLGPADERHKHVTHPPTLAAEAAHPLREVPLEVLRSRLQRHAWGSAQRSYGGDDLEDVVGALDSVAASLTR